MSSDGAKGTSIVSRIASSRPLLLGIGVLIVVIVAVVVVVAVVATRDSDPDDARLADEGASAAVTSPFDMTELPADTSLDLVSEASFVSILVPNENGSLTSYGVSADLPAARALAVAVADAEQVDEDIAASVTATTVPLASGSTGGTATITFVLASRETLSFALALDEGLIAREGKAWRPEGDLRALVEAAIKSPQ